MSEPNPFNLSARDLQKRLSTKHSFFPELETARGDPATLANAPQTRSVLAQTEALMDRLEAIPQTTYSHYRRFLRSGERQRYESPYFLKRTALAGAALRLFLGQSALKDAVQDLLWDICEETTWVLPAHETNLIDLFSSETGFVLAEALTLLGDTLDAEVRQRVRQETERRIFDPYLRFHALHHWYRGLHNWNGVCNSSVAATFLLLDAEPGRAAQALKLALAGLEVFLDKAFEEDGSSTEGIAYWHYGLINFVALSEMLRARSGGRLDLLVLDKLKRIAAYPAKMQLSGAHFVSFSDCDETVTFNPGVIQRLSERTSEPSLLNLLASPATLGGDWRLTMMLRNLLWWDGRHPQAEPLHDAVLPVGGTVRLVGRSPQGTSAILAVKAGHNAEHHNQNDVGSFMLHVGGENLLADPGRGLYSRDYFSTRRYENVFANSYGHSVPRIEGHLQGAGRAFSGELVDVQTEGPVKRVLLELARAYPAPNLISAKRQLWLRAEGQETWTARLHDDFYFGGAPGTAEEAFVTWLDTHVEAGVALLYGERYTLQLTIEAPQGAHFKLVTLEEESRANDKPGILKRLSFDLPEATHARARVRMALTTP